MSALVGVGRVDIDEWGSPRGAPLVPRVPWVPAVGKFAHGKQISREDIKAARR